MSVIDKDQADKAVKGLASIVSRFNEEFGKWSDLYNLDVNFGWGYKTHKALTVTEVTAKVYLPNYDSDKLQKDFEKISGKLGNIGKDTESQ